MNKPMTQADIYKAIEEIDEIVSKKLLAIERAEKQEPVAWTKTNDLVCALLRQAHDVLACASHPPRKEWVGLTEDEMSEIYNKNYDLYDTDMTYMDFFIVQRDVEAKLKEKNGG